MDDFEYTGLFYNIHGYKCRKYLDIKRTHTNLTSPDIMVIMMNPGNSYPYTTPINYPESTPVPTKPDNTQKQIVKIMNNDSHKFDYARVLNLSDIQEADSKKLIEIIKSRKIMFEHSIFTEQRKKDLESLYVKDVPVILAWGVDRNLIPLAEKALEMINSTPQFGFIKPRATCLFYHPNPRNEQGKYSWIREITKQIMDFYNQNNKNIRRSFN